MLPPSLPDQNLITKVIARLTPIILENPHFNDAVHSAIEYRREHKQLPEMIARHFVERAFTKHTEAHDDSLLSPAVPSVLQELEQALRDKCPLCGEAGGEHKLACNLGWLIRTHGFKEETDDET